jgi:hypothetical protein
MVVAVVALVLGLASGWLCQRLPLRPIVRDIVSAVVGWILGGVSAVFVTILIAMQRDDTAGLGAISLGLSDTTALGLLAMMAVAIVGHLALRRSGFSRYSAILLGAGAAVIAALWAESGVVVSS